jgi:cytochrome c oxidase cbb3-type subunit 3
MVGISLGSLKRFGRWLSGLSVRARVIGAVVILVVVLSAAWLARTAQYEARLVRADPDVAAADSALMKFAAGPGHAVFDHRCASCHGATGRGDTARGVPNLTDNDVLYGVGLASDIETVVLYGIRAPNAKTWRLADMPAFARPVPYPREPLLKPLTPGDINDLIQFLASVRGAPYQPDAAGRGAKLYSDKGGCYDCHASDAHGDNSIGGPNLADNIWLYGAGDPKTIFDTIAYGRAGFCPAWDGRLRPAKIREVALYVYSLSHGSPSQTKPSAQ